MLTHLLDDAGQVVHRLVEGKGRLTGSGNHAAPSAGGLGYAPSFGGGSSQRDGRQGDGGRGGKRRRGKRRNGGKRPAGAPPLLEYPEW